FQSHAPRSEPRRSAPALERAAELAGHHGRSAQVSQDSAVGPRAGGVELVRPSLCRRLSTWKRVSSFKRNYSERKPPGETKCRLPYQPSHRTISDAILHWRNPTTCLTSVWSAIPTPSQSRANRRM